MAMDSCGDEERWSSCSSVAESAPTASVLIDDLNLTHKNSGQQHMSPDEPRYRSPRKVQSRDGWSIWRREILADHVLLKPCYSFTPRVAVLLITCLSLIAVICLGSAAVLLAARDGSEAMFAYAADQYLDIVRFNPT